MQTETDAFYQSDDESFHVCGMLMPDGDIGISAHDPFDVITVSLSKRKAAKLARQILELSGETKQKLAAENKQLRELLKGVVIEFDSEYLDADAYGLMCGIKKELGVIDENNPPSKG
ncbi:hypothetical protein [Vibrio cholerae]|uniref:hypothetical protein n=1 Tax=Vibrio cholerae TaxID=666 RepID=UPI00115A2654|nr:hypothetical protein [Vibrio cholerae]TQQ41093.1 hypothetical protein FLL70_04940 [Vibrio cholerae]